MRRIILTICVSLLAFAAVAQTNIQVNVPKVVTLDEQFNISFIIDGSRPTSFDWNPGDDFENLWGPTQGRNSRVQIINGQRTESSQTTYSYVLRPYKVGKFTIPPASATVNGQKIYSSGVEVEVIEAASSANYSDQSAGSQMSTSSNEDSAPEVVLTLSVNKKEVVVGEPITASLKLYTRVDIDGIETIEYPVFDGFWTQVTYEPVNLSLEREVLDGILYEATIIREYVVIPQHSGEIEIPSARLVLLQNVPILYYGFVTDYQTVRHKAESQPIVIKVNSLPTPAPESFEGGVGTYSVSATLSSSALKTHESAYLELTVTGRGNIQLLEVPDIDFPQEMESYDPTSTGKIDPNGLSGKKVYEYPFIPRVPGQYELGPWDYTYYDINRKEYVTITIPAMTVDVVEDNDVGESSDQTVLPVRGDRYNKNHSASDIRQINDMASGSGLKSKGQFFLGSKLFWSLIVFLIAAALVIYFLFKRYYERSADVVGMKHRKATKMALKRLRKASIFLKKEQGVEFYAELYNALLSYASDKLNIPMSDLSKDKISEVFLVRGASEDDVRLFVEILDSCEFARFAPNSADQSMASDYVQAIKAISSIDTGMKANRTMRGRLLLMIAFLSLSTAVHAADGESAESLWDAACESYRSENYSDAIMNYEAIVEMGLESPELYYNLGNSYYKSGDYANAVLFYERTLKLNPSYSDAQYNLDHVNKHILKQKEAVPEFFLKGWFRKVSYTTDSDGWAVVFLSLLAVTLVLALVFLLAKTILWKRIGFYAGIFTLLMMFGALSFSIWQKNDYEDSGAAVVMKIVSARSAPSSDSSGKHLFELIPGSKVYILEIRGASTKISTGEGSQGWVNTSDIEII